MSLELDKDVRSEAIRSIERYFAENLEQRIGNIQAGALLNYFVEEIGPCLYNRGVADAQERMQVQLVSLKKTEFHAVAPSIDACSYQTRRSAAKCQACALARAACAESSASSRRDSWIM